MADKVEDCIFDKFIIFYFLNYQAKCNEVLKNTS